MDPAQVPTKSVPTSRAHKASLLRRRQGLKKKASELATLCGIEVALICYDAEGNKPEIWPDNPVAVRDTVTRFLALDQQQRDKRKLNLASFSGDKKQEDATHLPVENQLENLNPSHKESVENQLEVLNPLCTQSADVRYPLWPPQLDVLSEEMVRELTSILDKKLLMVKKAKSDLHLGNASLRGKELVISKKFKKPLDHDEPRKFLKTMAMGQVQPRMKAHTTHLGRHVMQPYPIPLESEPLNLVLSSALISTTSVTNGGCSGKRPLLIGSSSNDPSLVVQREHSSAKRKFEFEFDSNPRAQGCNDPCRLTELCHEDDGLNLSLGSYHHHL